jgi:hypothetical protein
MVSRVVMLLALDRTASTSISDERIKEHLTVIAFHTSDGIETLRRLYNPLNDHIVNCKPFMTTATSRLFSANGRTST